MNWMLCLSFGMKLPNILNRLFGTASKYDLIDPELYRWAAKHGIQIFTKYQDEQVRSTDVVGNAGKKCQIWIDHPDKTGNFVVNIWNYKTQRAKRIKQLYASKTDISDKLEEAYKTAQEWLNETGLKALFRQVPFAGL